MSAFTFCCFGVGGDPYAQRAGLLASHARKDVSFEASDWAEATVLARDRGWHVDMAGPYPQVACSEVCFEATRAQWERQRPAREAARKEPS